MARDFADLNEEAMAAWERIAPWWDDHMGDDGNSTHRGLVAPAAERLLDISPGQTILEAACGAGIFARRMAELGANVVAFDASRAFLEAVRKRTAEYADRVELHRIDATDKAGLLSLGERRFDAAVCNMALMDMADIGPLAHALPRLLKPGGRFVFSVPHPCFNMVSVKRAAEEEDRDGDLAIVRYAKVSKYLTPSATRATGIAGQPVPHYFFDRPLSLLLNIFFDAGFVMDALEELPSQPRDDGERLLAWSSFPEIPSVLAARMILAG